MTNERSCPHCGASVPADRVICPQCNRTLPVAGVSPAPPAPPPAQEGSPGAAPAAAAPDLEISLEPEPPSPGQAAAPQAPPPQAWAFVPPAPPPTAPPPPPAAPGPYQPPPGPYSPPPYPTGPMPPGQDSSLGVIGLILAIIGLPFCCCPLLGPAGLAMCIIAHHKRPTGTSLAGIIIGALATLMFVLYCIFSMYLGMHPAWQSEMMRQLMQRGIPVPPNFPGR